METIYRDIAMRTGGNIYIGVVGPVRTGKSTLIKRLSYALHESVVEVEVVLHRKPSCKLLACLEQVADIAAAAADEVLNEPGLTFMEAAGNTAEKACLRHGFAAGIAVHGMAGFMQNGLDDGRLSGFSYANAGVFWAYCGRKRMDDLFIIASPGIQITHFTGQSFRKIHHCFRILRLL